jgi:hypothetical protein
VSAAASRASAADGADGDGGADLVGHKGTSVTERVYRHQLKPTIRKGADTINAIFKTAREDAETA